MVDMVVGYQGVTHGWYVYVVIRVVGMGDGRLTGARHYDVLIGLWLQ